MISIEVKQLLLTDNACKFIACVNNSKSVYGRATTRIFENPDRLYLSRIDSYLAGFEIGTALLLMAALYGVNRGITVLDGDFNPDFRKNRTRRDLQLWYRERNIAVSVDGYDLIGGLPNIANACRGILVAKGIDCRMTFV